MATTRRGTAPSNSTRGGDAGQSDMQGVSADPWGAIVFRILMLAIPVVTVAMIVWRIWVSDKASAAQALPPTVTVVEKAGEVVTTTTYVSSTLALGAFDPGLGSSGWLASAILILLVGAAMGQCQNWQQVVSSRSV